MKLKFKPSVVYPVLLVLLICVVVIFSQTNVFKQDKEQINTEQMPDDEVHKGLKDKNAPHSMMNISPEFKHQMEQLKKNIDDNPNDTLKIREYANLLAASHQPDEALKYYDMILSKAPKRIDILFEKSKIYYAENKLNEAENITNSILKLEPENPLAQYNIGAIAATKGDKEKARKIWNEVIKKYPKEEVSELAKKSLEKL
ncbi:MAG: hypothetical protein STSR0008_25070 [Ignavibacterium sp.]